MGRHIQVAFLGADRTRILKAVCLCIEAARPDDGFEFMVDARVDPDAAHETAVLVETLWNDLPNPSLAHLRAQRHELLLGVDLVIDVSDPAAAEVPAGDAAPTGPGAAPDLPPIVDFAAPAPARPTAAAARRPDAELALDMSMLCPRAVFVPPVSDAGFPGRVVAAVDEALAHAEDAGSPSP